MKECWINVYEHLLTGQRWYGNKYSLEEAEDQRRHFQFNFPGELKYRLHVKLKEERGLSRHYPYEYGRLQDIGCTGRWKPYMEKLPNGEWINI